jgi:hypothetical protein
MNVLRERFIVTGQLCARSGWKSAEIVPDVDNSGSECISKVGAHFGF